VEAPLLGAPAAWALWGAGLLGPFALCWGGRLAHPGLFAFALCHFGLIVSMGLSFRAPERLLLWLCLLLPFGPIDERGLMHKARSPHPRFALMILFASLYGSTGLKKAMQPGWWSGEILALDLLDRWHAGGPLALWLSGHARLVQAASVFTILVELSWPLLVWGRRANPWLLAAGLALHLGIGVVMDVGMLGWLALSMYPVLLDPGVGCWLRTKCRSGEKVPAG
jgi:hypothetical protein